MSVALKEFERGYQFFLSEIYKGDEKEIGYVVELMRAAGHISDLFKLLMLTHTDDSLDDFESVKHDVEMESVRILLFNVSASQLREALKLFDRFRKFEGYAGIKGKFNKEQCEAAERLEKCVIEFDEKKGILFDTLKPLRDITFHYNTDEAAKSVIKRIEREKEEKPEFYFIDNEVFEFGLGRSYDSEIYSKYLFWGKNGLKDLLSAQKMILEIQKNFLVFVSALSQVIMARAGIKRGRKYDWFLKHFYGFKP